MVVEKRWGGCCCCQDEAGESTKLLSEERKFRICGYPSEKLGERRGLVTHPYSVVRRCRWVPQPQGGYICGWSVFLHSWYSFSVFHLLFKDPQLGQFFFFFCLSISTFIAMPFWTRWTSGFFLIYVFPAWSCRYSVSPLDSTTTHGTSAIQFSTLFFTLFFFFYIFLLITQLLAWLSCDRRSFGIFDGYIRR